MVLCHGTVELLLHHKLNRAVDGEHCRLAVIAAIGAPPKEDRVEDRTPLSVNGQALLAHLALEQGIKRVLHTAQPLVL